MRLRKHRFSDDSMETGIDLAPMLDFVLNLLIFFIITAVFVKEVGITVSRPSAKKQEQPQKDVGTVFIQIDREGNIMIGRRTIDLRAVRANVERFRAEKPEAPVVVAADKEAPTGILVQVMDQVRQGGVENVSIAASGG